MTCRPVVSPTSLDSEQVLLLVPPSDMILLLVPPSDIFQLDFWNNEWIFRLCNFQQSLWLWQHYELSHPLPTIRFCSSCSVQTLKELRTGVLCLLSEENSCSAASPVLLPQIAHTFQLKTTDSKYSWTFFHDSNHGYDSNCWPVVMYNDWEVYSASLVCADCHAYSCGAVHRYGIENIFFLK